MSIDKKRVAAVELLEEFVGYAWDEKTEEWVVATTTQERAPAAG